MKENQSENKSSFDIDSSAIQSAETPPTNRSFKSLLIILPILLAAGAIGYKYLVKRDNIAKIADTETRFLELNEITVNLRQGAESNPAWLRVRVSLEINGKVNYEAAKKLEPKIVDVFQTYLKELRRVDLDGSFALYKIKDEMLLRINTIISPAKIEGICFQEFIMQVI